MADKDVIEKFFDQIDNGHDTIISDPVLLNWSGEFRGQPCRLVCNTINGTTTISIRLPITTNPYRMDFDCF